MTGDRADEREPPRHESEEAPEHARHRDRDAGDAHPFGSCRMPRILHTRPGIPVTPQVRKPAMASQKPTMAMTLERVATTGTKGWVMRRQHAALRRSKKRRRLAGTALVFTSTLRRASRQRVGTR